MTGVNAMACLLRGQRLHGNESLARRLAYLMNASEAKQLNEQWLRDSGITVNPALPQIEEPTQLRPRSAEKVATRAWVLSHVMGVGMGRTADEVLDQLRAAELMDFLTPRERNLLRKPRFGHSDKAWAACLSEAVHGCAWALGLLNTGPLEKFPAAVASHFPRGSDPFPSIHAAHLRNFDEIYLRADLNYRLHWAARQARFDGAPFPFPEAYLQPRRHAVDWIVGVPHDWDDVPLNT
jgi:hypothetical protein